MNKDEIAVKVLKYIMTVTDETLSGVGVKTLSYDFKIDRFKLSRNFKKVTGLTLEKFIFREKMIRSAFLLMDNTYVFTVKEISQRLGYCSCDYFIKRFKDFYGVAPGSFREFKTGRSIDHRYMRPN